MIDPRTTPPHAAIVAQLAALAATPHPDAALIAACDRLTLLVEKREVACRIEGKGSAAIRNAFFRAHYAEMDRLYIAITRMEPRSLLGHQVRAAAALHCVGTKGKCKPQALLGLLGAAGPAMLARRQEEMAALLPDIWSGGIIGEFVQAAIGGLVHASHEVAE